MFLSYLPAGSYVGEMALIGGGTRTATVKAAVKIEVKSGCTGAAFSAAARSQSLRLLKGCWERHGAAPKNVNAAHRGSRKDSFSGVVDMYSQTATFLVENGIGEATDVLLIDENLCVGCDNCEKACADSHDGLSRLDRETGRTYAHLHVPTSCRHCENPACMADCPPNAIHRGADGEVVIDDTCIGCGNCQAQLPVRRDPDGQVCRQRKAGPAELDAARAPGPARANPPRNVALQAHEGRRREAEKGDQVRHVLRHRWRPGMRPRLPDRRRDPRIP